MAVEVPTPTGPARPDLTILETRIYRGPNVWSYQQAIHAIGKASNGRGIYEGPGISIKLSALHPRYSRAQYDRVMARVVMAERGPRWPSAPA